MVENDWKKMVANWKFLKKHIVFVKEQYSKTKFNKEKLKNKIQFQFQKKYTKEIQKSSV